MPAPLHPLQHANLRERFNAKTQDRIILKQVLLHSASSQQQHPHGWLDCTPDSNLIRNRAEHAQILLTRFQAYSVSRGGALGTAWRRVSLQMVLAAATAALLGLTPICLAFTTSQDRCCTQHATAIRAHGTANSWYQSC